MEKGRFEGKVFLITGAAGGIGFATAKAAAAQGAAVVFSDLKEEDGRRAKAELEKLTADVDFLPMDMTVEENSRRLVEFAADKYGHLDVLVNNAGISGRPGTVETMDAAMFQKVLDCNVMSMFYCSHYAVGRMVRQETPGAVVNVASVAGIVAFPGNIAYVTSKHAVVGLTKCMALDYAAKHIRVNAVSPGIIKTPMQEKSMEFLKNKQKEGGEATKTAFKGLSPQNRIADPAEVADVILFLASAEASHITGANLPVDGGFTLY